MITPSSDKQLRICFVHLDSYPVLIGASDTTYLGGESVQHSLLAKAFSGRGHKVSAVVADFGQPQREVISGVDVLRTYDRSAGIPVLRFFHPRLTSVWHALKLADADIYYQSCAGGLAGILATFCRIHGKKQVYRVAHDTDCVPGEQLIRFWRDRKLYEFGLRRAHLVAAQTATQKKLLRDNYGLESTIVNMVVEEPKEHLDGPRDIDVLWVNNLRPFKSPETLLEVARRCPALQFVMIGGPCPGLEEYYEHIISDAQGIPNLMAVGPVPYVEVNSYFARAKLFLNTSESEGFPNSFLQAWIRGVPIVSFFDPDAIIAEQGLGVRVNSVEDMSAILEELIGDEVRTRDLSDHVRKFALDAYSSDSVVTHYESLLGLKA